MSTQSQKAYLAGVYHHDPNFDINSDVAKLTKISGFPEWLPEQRMAEEALIDKIRAIFRSHGFCPIETPAVELLSTLLNKGEIDKEVYSIKRYHAKDVDEAEFGLHFDLTVPLARYVAQHFANLSFPFKRYQIQKVWRGERPQKGRFREFYQCDIDIIGRDSLPIACDAEVIDAMNMVVMALGVGKHKVRLNNRKLLLGIYASLGLSEAEAKQVVVAVDKLSKIGKDGVSRELADKGIENEAIGKILELTDIRIIPGEAEYILGQLEVKNRSFEEGKSEILELLGILSDAALAHLEVDLSLARGLDYYTGSILEMVLVNHPEFGSVASGGRYDDLASRFINKKLPGVGVSFGLSRFLDLAFSEKLIATDRKSPSQVLVTVAAEEGRKEANLLADSIRMNGLACEVFYAAPRLGKQIDYASAKGMRYVLFLGEGAQLEVKDLKTKEQVKISDLEGWCRDVLGGLS